jgi:hypothetical protein
VFTLAWWQGRPPGRRHFAQKILKKSLKLCAIWLLTFGCTCGIILM